MVDADPAARTVVNMRGSGQWRCDAERVRHRRGIAAWGAEVLAVLCLLGVGLAAASCGTQTTALRHAGSSSTFAGGAEGPVAYMTQCDLAHGVITSAGSVTSRTSIPHAGLVFTAWTGAKVVARSAVTLKPLSPGQGVAWRTSARASTGTTPQRCQASVVLGLPPYSAPN